MYVYRMKIKNNNKYIYLWKREVRKHPHYVDVGRLRRSRKSDRQPYGVVNSYTYP